MVVVVVLLSVLALVVGGACGIAARAMLVRQQQEEQAFAEAEMVPVRRGLANHQLEQLPAIPFHKADCESVEARNTECIISMEEFSEGQFIMRLPCDHQLTYHLGVQYFSTATECPLCRRDIAAWTDELAAADGQGATREAASASEERAPALAGALASSSAPYGAAAGASSTRDARPVRQPRPPRPPPPAAAAAPRRHTVRVAPSAGGRVPPPSLQGQARDDDARSHASTIQFENPIGRPGSSAVSASRGLSSERLVDSGQP